MRVLALCELLNKVKYRNKDTVWMLVVHFFFASQAAIVIQRQSSVLSGFKTLEAGALFRRHR